jgi:Nuclear transport factor 2 (NTF2) domain
MRTPPRQPVKKSTPPLARMSQGSNWAQVKEEDSTPSAVEIVHQASLESGDRRASAGEFGSHASVGQMSDPSWDPSQEGPSRKQEDLAHTSTGSQTMVNTQAAIASLQRSPARGTPSDHSRLSIHRQTTSDVSIFPSSRAWTPSSSPRAPRTSSERRTTSPQLLQPLPSPSQRTTLRNILQRRRKVDRETSELLKPPAISPSPSPSLRKLYPTSKKQQTENPSKQYTESFADAVAAAINESARLDRGGSSSTPGPSTPLRLYKKRPSLSPAVDSERGIERSPMSLSEAGHQARRSLSSAGYSSPPIAVLVPADSSPECLRADLASSSTYGDEYDELDLSYPSSPMLPPRETLSELHPLATLPTELQVSAEPTEPASQPPSLLNLGSPSPGKNAGMQSVALEYLERYFRTFDMDRHALAEAYAPDAAFSCSSRNLRAQGRDGILDALRRLGPGALCSGDNVEYDVLNLGPGIGVLLVVLGTLSGTRDNGEVGYTMSFVLRPAREDLDRSVWFFPVNSRHCLPCFLSFFFFDGTFSSAGVPWPLVASVHQMALREPSA